MSSLSVRLDIPTDIPSGYDAFLETKVNRIDSPHHGSEILTHGGPKPNAPVLSSVPSAVENAIVNAQNPIEIPSNKAVSVNGQSGLLINEPELCNFRGPIPLSQYQINSDPNPHIIKKKPTQNVNYVQDINVRYLKPPTPPPPGEIVITQEPNKPIPPAPPVIIRQQPPRPATPPPLVIREAPPPPPPHIPRRHLCIPGKIIPPPARKLVVERLPVIPTKPQSIYIDRWLPYDRVKRRVIFQKTNVVDPVVVNPKNLLVQWESPSVCISRELRQHGIVRANPAEYIQKYGPTLRQPSELPLIAANVPSPNGCALASQVSNEYIHELEGDVGALSLLDLDRAGLGHYKTYASRFPIPVITPVPMPISSSPEPAQVVNQNVDVAPPVQHVQQAHHAHHAHHGHHGSHIHHAHHIHHVHHATHAVC